MNEKECKVEVFSRVVGFFRPVQSWNKGKTEEFKDRKEYQLDTYSVGIEDGNSRITKTVTG